MPQFLLWACDRINVLTTSEIFRAFMSRAKPRLTICSKRQAGLACSLTSSPTSTACFDHHEVILVLVVRVLYVATWAHLTQWLPQPSYIKVVGSEALIEPNCQFSREINLILTTTQPRLVIDVMLHVLQLVTKWSYVDGIDFIREDVVVELDAEFELP